MAKKSIKSAKIELSDAMIANRRYSVFNCTPLQGFFDKGVDLTDDFDAMADVFESAGGEALGFTFSDDDKERFVRSQPLKNSIIKVLLFVGVAPQGNGFPVVARLIEMLVVHPELDLDEVMSDFANTHRTNVGALTRLVDRCLNMRDQHNYDRVTMLTETHPFTAKDALCDLAVFINIHF